MRHELIPLLEKEPVIPAVREEGELASALAAPAEAVFLLCGDLLTVGDCIRAVHEAGKRCIVHVDLINGLAPKEIAVDFLARLGADGVISTRPLLIRRGRELGLLTVLRVFAIDSKAVANLRREAESAAPDVIEILPGTVTRVIGELARTLSVPLIAGGLLSGKEEVLAALGAGALCVSASDARLWKI